MQGFIDKYGVLRGTLPQKIRESLDRPVGPRLGYAQIIPSRNNYQVQEPEWAAELPEPRFYVDSTVVSDAQNLLRRAWAGDGAAVKQIQKEAVIPGPYQEVGLEIQTSVEPGVLELETGELWNFVCLLFLLDYSQGKTKLCRNKDCSAPCFIQTRKDQQYCSHKCAVLINVRRFQARQEARKELKAGRQATKHPKSNRGKKS
jgi:hypothetical protein